MLVDVVIWKRSFKLSVFGGMIGKELKRCAEFKDVDGLCPNAKVCTRREIIGGIDRNDAIHVGIFLIGEHAKIRRRNTSAAKYKCHILNARADGKARMWTPCKSDFRRESNRI